MKKRPHWGFNWRPRRIPLGYHEWEPISSNVFKQSMDDFAAERKNIMNAFSLQGHSDTPFLDLLKTPPKDVLLPPQRQSKPHPYTPRMGEL